MFSVDSTALVRYILKRDKSYTDKIESKKSASKY